MRKLPAAILSLALLFFINIPTVSGLTLASFWPQFAIPTLPPRPTLPPFPSIKPVPISTPTAGPSSTPNPTPTAISTPTAKPTTQPITNSQEYLMKQISDYRISQGLPPVKTDPYTCNFAKTRAQEISVAFNHDGFRNRINSKTLPYPGYHYVTENIAMNSNYKNVVSMWINSAGHAANMRADTPSVCVEQFGNFFAFEGWRP